MSKTNDLSCPYFVLVNGTSYRVGSKAGVGIRGEAEQQILTVQSEVTMHSDQVTGGELLSQIHAVVVARDDAGRHCGRYDADLISSVDAATDGPAQWHACLLSGGSDIPMAALVDDHGVVGFVVALIED